MASKSSAPVLILFLSLGLGLALAQIPGIPGVPVPGIPGFPMPWIPGAPIPGIPGVVAEAPGMPTLQGCWASIQGISGCYPEISRAFQAGGRADFTIGPDCCMAITDISTSCWPSMFPYNPFFPPMLQAYCARYAKSHAGASSIKG